MFVTIKSWICAENCKRRVIFLSIAPKSSSWVKSHLCCFVFYVLILSPLMMGKPLHVKNLCKYFSARKPFLNVFPGFLPSLLCNKHSAKCGSPFCSALYKSNSKLLFPETISWTQKQPLIWINSTQKPMVKYRTFQIKENKTNTFQMYHLPNENSKVSGNPGQRLQHQIHSFKQGVLKT